MPSTQGRWHESPFTSHQSLVTVLFLLCASVANAQALPAAHVYSEDKEFRVEAAAVGVAWTMDTISTAHGMHERQYHYEVGNFYYGSRSTPKIMGAWGLVAIGAVAVSYEWKRHVTKKWLHPLWRVPLLMRTHDHLGGAIGNWAK